MYFLNRFLPIFFFLSILAGFESILVKPNWLWWIIPLLISFLFLALWQLMNRKLTNEYWQFFLAPLLFLSSGLLFFILLTPKNDWLKHLLILLIAGLLAIILESILNFLHRQGKYPLFAIENIYSYLDLITFFFFLASFYFLAVFSNFPLWFLLLFVIIITGLLSYQVFWANKISNNKKSLVFILVISLILGELFWIINFWPTDFYFNALFLSLFYYIIIGVSRYHLVGHLKKKMVLKYLIIGGICLVIGLLTVRWS